MRASLEIIRNTLREFLMIIATVAKASCKHGPVSYTHLFQQGTGAMQIGFAKVSGKTVYYGEDGAMRYEHQLIDGDYYYFHPKTGAMQTGLLDFGGDRWGFYGADGKQIPMIDAKTAIDLSLIHI